MERVFRGLGMSQPSLAKVEGIELAPRMDIAFHCTNAHKFTVTFSIEAQLPTEWDCPHCGLKARRSDGTRPERKPARKVRRHWDMLRERRSIPELEALLAERLAEIRAEK
jgi:hypothetical protein